MTAPAVPVRETARIALLDEHDRVLLIKIERTDVNDLDAPIFKPFWITPGGKLEPGETPDEAVRRELKEETGLSDAQIVGRVWYGEHFLDWKGVRTNMKEHFYLARAASSAVSVEGMEEAERAVYRNHRWWPIAELRPSGELFIPKDLPELLQDLVDGPVPTETVTIDLSTPVE